MKYQLPVDGTDIYLEFDTDEKRLYVRSKSNPQAGFFLRENGLAVLDFWLGTVDLDDAYDHPETLQTLRKMDLIDAPDGMCPEHKKPLDDCGCFIKSFVPHPPGETIRADCGHMVVVPLICQTCNNMLCEACDKTHDCDTFQPVDSEEEDEE